MIVRIIIIILTFILFYQLRKKYEYFQEEILVVDFIGGLGNQLFFLACAFEYSKKYNKKLIIKQKKNISSYGKNRIFNKIIYKNFNIQNIETKNFKILNEKNLNSYIPNNLVLSKKEYFQDYNLSLKTRKDFIKKIYFGTENKLKNLLKKYKVISNKINVCIHIRYSDDFTPSNWDGIYSSTELNIIKNNCVKNYQENNILIFSNDQDKTKKYFDKLKNINFVQENDYEELYIMSKCNIYYCSPSTFNWWGIYLNLNPDKVYLLWENNTKIRNDLYKNYEYLGKKLKFT